MSASELIPDSTMKGFPQMKFRLFGLFALCCAVAINLCSDQIPSGYSQTTKSTPGLSVAEQDLLSEINQARAQPQTYATYLEQLKPLFKGKDYTATGRETLRTQEGWDAVEDAIRFLRAAKPLGPLSASQGLCLAASAHVKDQSASGATGHTGADRSEEHTSELQSQSNLVCRLLLEKKKNIESLSASADLI